MADIKENTELNDVKDKVDEIVVRMNNVNQNVKDHNVHLQSLIKFHEDKIEDKFEDQFEKLFTKKQKKITDAAEYMENRMNSMDTDLKEIIQKHKQEKFGQ